MPRKILLSGLILLCLLSAAFGAKETDRHQEDSAKAVLMSPSQQILHALDRLTFGPHAGDVAAVQAIGIDKWIEQQLNPAGIPENPQVSSKLATFDTLNMATAEMVHYYPTPQMVKQMVDGRIPFPIDGQTHYMVQKLARRVQAQESAAQAGQNDNPDPHAKSIPNRWQLSLDDLEVFENGKPAEQVALLEPMPAAEQYDVLDSMPNGVRQKLYPLASPELRRKIQIFNGPVQVVNQDLIESKLIRAVYSSRQLQEVLTDFWFNHFNVNLDKGADRYMVTSYERYVIRPNVLGHFKDLLLATAESPAMLFYLDNWESAGPDTRPNPRPNAPRRQGLNENYGRELMELHTLGVDGGYTQKDVTEVARCFTGWTIRDPRRGGGFDFNARLHDDGEKHVLGVTIPAGGGVEDGLKVIDILAHHPSTAHFISKSLAIRFVSDNPPESLVVKMAKTFLATDGDLREVMRTMIYSPEFWNAGNFRSKVKSPLEMVVSAVRAVGADIDYANSLNGIMNQLGEPLYRKVEPTGYSNRGVDWLNSASLLARMNFAIALTQNKIQGIKVDQAQFDTAPSVIEHSLLLTDPSLDSAAAIAAGLGQLRATGPSVAALTLGSPDFQRR
jgi:uncharacterized protein (DUF1800 family)